MRIEALAPQVNLAPSRGGSDNDLVAKCCSGDLEAFNELVRRYRNRIFNLAWQLLGDRDEAEDVAQEVSIHAFEHIGDFRHNSQIFTWLTELRSMHARCVLGNTARLNRYRTVRAL